MQELGDRHFFMLMKSKMENETMVYPTYQSRAKRVHVNSRLRANHKDRAFAKNKLLIRCGKGESNTI